MKPCVSCIYLTYCMEYVWKSSLWIGIFQRATQRARQYWPTILLVFSVTPFKIDQNKNQNRLIDKVQNLGNERRYVYKDPRQDSGQRNISYTRYPKKCFTHTYRDLYEDAMLVLTWMSSNMAEGNQQKHLLPSFATKAFVYSSRNSQTLK